MSDSIPEARIVFVKSGGVMSSREYMTKTVLHGRGTMKSRVLRYPGKKSNGSYSYDFGELRFRYGNGRVYVVEDRNRQLKQIWLRGRKVCEGTNLKHRMFPFKLSQAKPKKVKPAKPKKVKPTSSKAVKKPTLRFVRAPKRDGVYYPHKAVVSTRFTKIKNVNVIIPTYNQKKALLSTLGALLPQLKKGDEVIVVDAGSTDGTVKAMRKRFPKIQLLEQKHRGIAAARNRGMRAVKPEHNCANIMLVRPGEKIGKNFVAKIMKGIWTQYNYSVKTVTPKTICLYTSYVHGSVIKPLEKPLKQKGHKIIWGIPWSERNPREPGWPKADIYVTSSSEHHRHGTFPIPRTIYMPHGLSPAEMQCFFAHEIHRFKGALLTGQWYMDKIKKGVWNIDYGKYPKNFFKIVGWPKGDILFKPKLKKTVEEYVKKLRLKLPYDQTVLYSPTGFWRSGFGCFRETIWPLLEAVNYLEMNLVIRIHFTTCKYSPQKEACAEAKRQIKTMKNVTWTDFGSVDNITPLYSLADVVVSDASSTVLEFLQTGNIGIEMMNRIPSVKNQTEDWRGKSFPEGSTVKCWNPNKLKENIMTIAHKPETYAPQIKKWQKRLLYKLDGKATDRAVAAIEKILGD